MQQFSVHSGRVSIWRGGGKRCYGFLFAILLKIMDNQGVALPLDGPAR
jgi:hypothetical protein